MPTHKWSELRNKMSPERRAQVDAQVQRELQAIDANPVIFTYDCEVSIGGPKTQQAQEALNRAWGFEDGQCNRLTSKGLIVSKPGADDSAFIEANHSMTRHTRISIEVSLHKNGKKTYRLKPQ